MNPRRPRWILKSFFFLSRESTFDIDLIRETFNLHSLWRAGIDKLGWRVPLALFPCLFVYSGEFLQLFLFGRGFFLSDGLSDALFQLALFAQTQLLVTDQLRHPSAFLSDSLHTKELRLSRHTCLDSSTSASPLACKLCIHARRWVLDQLQSAAALVRFSFFCLRAHEFMNMRCPISVFTSARKMFVRLF